MWVNNYTNYSPWNFEMTNERRAMTNELRAPQPFVYTALIARFFGASA